MAQEEIEVQDQAEQPEEVSQETTTDNAEQGNDQAITEDDIYNMSDEDFNKGLDDLGDFNLDDFEEKEEQEPEAKTVADDDNLLEQPNEDTKETTDEDQTSKDENTDSSQDEKSDDKDSKKDEDEKSKSKDEQTFTLDNIPMDEVLPIKIKAAGGEVQATMAELISGFQKGLGFTKNMQEISSFRPHIAMIKENNLSTDDLNRFIDMKNGDHNALASLMKELKIDALDIDDDAGDNYKANNYVQSNEVLDMNEVKQTIQNDKENISKVQTYLNEIPEDFYKEITSSGKNLNNFYEDVKSGTFAKVKPVMDKMAFLGSNGKSGIELYQAAVASINAQSEQKNNSAQSKEAADKVNETNKKAEEKKKSIEKNQKKSDDKKILGKPTAKATGSDNIVNEEDIWSMDDSEFNKNFEKLFGGRLDV